ncbi:MAG TPA: Hsp70 family protein [Actinophytocola sp.]|uniref:Hsp70 family protein n=1 Tax=Actinophytocola sp. TaxID=1872138 RepID=UPI002DBB3E90|nr:Hsp70 family protein [Actinophytocola sp.]HEU5473849.1 Hsp70 family protein [Actinophytocola sp.]
MNVLSVDLGTSNTVAVLSAHGRPPRVVDVDGASMMPSAVFAAEDGSLMVGREAERRARLDPSRFEPNPKRRIDEGTLLLGDTIVPVTDALAGVLRRVADETSRQLGGKRPDEVRLTHPAQWGPVRRNTLLSAARQAGWGSNLVLVPEPVAAAAHFASFPGQTLAPGQALAVYDLGAGTFDVAIVGATQKGFVVLAEAGLPDLGGIDVDQALLEHVGRQVSQRDPAGWQNLLRPQSTGDRRAQRALREDVRAAKESLSRHPQTDLPLPEPFDDVLVTRLELEALIRPGMLRSVELLAATIRSTGMAADRLAGIYLVGGSSRIPVIATLIAEQLRVVPTSLDQPETAVALGAHHVPQEGITMRTSDISGTIEIVQRTKAMTPSATPYVPPTPSGPTVPSAFPNSGPQRVLPQGPPPGPPSGPVPVPGPAGPPPVGPQFVGHQVPAPPPARSNRKPLIILGAIVAVAVIAVGITFFATSGGGGGGGVAASECTDKTPDGDGFSKCMRTLAGKVVDNNDCASGVRMPTGGSSIPAPGATAATCQLGDDYTIFYYHFDSPEIADKNVDAFLNAFSKSKQTADGGDWSGGGLSGKYYSFEVLGVGAMLFTVEDSPVMGTLMKLSTDSSGESITDYFNEHVKPGSNG